MRNISPHISPHRRRDDDGDADVRLRDGQVSDTFESEDCHQGHQAAPKARHRVIRGRPPEQHHQQRAYPRPSA